MKIFEGKSPAERNKIIAAIVIGTLALLALGNLIFSPFSGSKKTITVNVSPTPTATASTKSDSVVTAMPKQSEIDTAYLSTPVFVQYPPSASDAGRNIFAFYEPPIPTPFSPTPTPIPVIKTPTPIPVPQPNILVSYISKQNVYAGEKGFKLEVGGDKFTPDTYIFFGGSQLPTTYISPQQMSADIPTNFIAGGGQRTIEVKSADGKFFSNIVIFNVQQPPTPQFQYIGVVSRKRGNNDTAYIQEQGKQTPSSVRLNDIIAGRFRLISISPAKLLVQDINLGFLAPYPIKLVDGSGQSASTRPNQNPNFPNDGNTYQPYQNNPNIPQPCPPGIPCNIPRYIPPTPQTQKDVDDNDDDDGNN
jgi:hypothetical protein